MTTKEEMAGNDGRIPNVDGNKREGKGKSQKEMEINSQQSPQSNRPLVL